MARIIGAIASSHTPTIGFALDAKKQDDPAWKPIFEAYEPVRAWLDDKRPDVLLIVYNDHITSFFFDHYAPFTLGVDDRYHVADEGGGARHVPPIGGHAGLSRHIVQSLMTDEFDIGTFRGRGLDHGCFSPLSVLLPHENGAWPTQIVPLQVGVLQFPIPTARRCFKLGQALRTAIESYPEDLKVALVATGGLSHQVHGERCGFNNPEWDARFMDLLESDPEALCRMTHAQYAELGGMEGAEVIMWLIMRGALSARVRCLHRSYYLPSMTGIATAVYENESPAPDEAFLAAHRTRIGEQLAGAERFAGTYPYTLERSAKGYRLNRFLHSLVEPEARAAFRADEGKAMAAAGLSEEEQALVRRRDWRGLIHYGAIFFVLEKLAAVTGVSNLDIYASMRGETLEDFMKTRNQQVTYSVAAQPA
ncbi:gallate dioxygenase [Novosphingobium sp. BL-8A]|uniref:gallate dioxygenase n=1 Tax=Novosphingobium sp. BL-8A TaxID=3127639 RepID=UPI0037568297